VRIAVGAPPNIILRQAGVLPGDVPAALMYRLPPQLGDRRTRLIRRLTIGDLSAYGLVAPKEGIMSRVHVMARHRRFSTGPSSTRSSSDASRSLPPLSRSTRSASCLQIELGSSLTFVIAATGYTAGLEPLVGHLDVLDERRVPVVHGGSAAVPGLRFIGYQPRPAQIGYLGAEATRAAKQIKDEPKRSPTPRRA
jgi:hypothetical protein